MEKKSRRELSKDEKQRQILSMDRRAVFELSTQTKVGCRNTEKEEPTLEKEGKRRKKKDSQKRDYE